MNRMTNTKTGEQKLRITLMKDEIIYQVDCSERVDHKSSLPVPLLLDDCLSP